MRRVWNIWFDRSSEWETDIRNECAYIYILKSYISMYLECNAKKPYRFKFRALIYIALDLFASMKYEIVIIHCLIYIQPSNQPYNNNNNTTITNNAEKQYQHQYSHNAKITIGECLRYVRNHLVKSVHWRGLLSFFVGCCFSSLFSGGIH